MFPRKLSPLALSLAALAAFDGSLRAQTPQPPAAQADVIETTLPGDANKSQVPIPSRTAQKAGSQGFSSREIVEIDWSLSTKLSDSARQKPRIATGFSPVERNAIPTLNPELAAPPQTTDAAAPAPKSVVRVAAAVSIRPTGARPADGTDHTAQPVASVAQSAGHSGATKNSAQQGDRKPALPGPVHDEIAQVTWSMERTSTAAHSARAARTGAEFKVECVPLVLWNPEKPGELLPEDAFNNLPPGACSELRDAYTAGHIRQSGQAQVATLNPEAAGGPANGSSTEGSIHPSDLQALRQLSPDGPVAGSAGQHYLSDLNQLMQGGSDWVFGNSALLDLAPEEGPAEEAGNYLDDLKSLVHPSAQTISSRGGRRILVASRSQTDESGEPPARLYSIPPRQDCDSAGDTPLAALFEPVSRIQATGESTSPPAMNRNAGPETSSELRYPDDQACAYLQSKTPEYYFTAPRYGVRRPSRNTHILFTNPLYYEDENLERCGQSNGCLTTAVSAVHFCTAIALTPYNVFAECPGDCIQTLPDCPTCHSFD